MRGLSLGDFRISDTVRPTDNAVWGQAEPRTPRLILRQVPSGIGAILDTVWAALADRRQRKTADPTVRVQARRAARDGSCRPRKA
jgi:hypothetical protein